MVISSEKKKKLANAMGGKTARACDNCIRKRARWYCAADDVFLCQFCDALAHSANPLARLHQRVRLKIASSSMEMEKIIPPPKWHQGFTKKSRTPRAKNRNKYGSKSNPIHLVPEIGSDEMNVMNSDEKQLSYDEVPVFDPFSGEVCFSGDFNDMQMVPIQSDDAITPDDESEVPFDLNELILPSDMELAEFAADVESLLGKNVVDEESCRLNMDSSERVMKVEEEMMMMMSFDYDSISSAVAWEEEEDEKMVKNKSVVVDNDDNVNNNIINVDDKLIIKKMLKLDYEGIIAAWDDERSPWATGDRPQLDCLLDCMHSDMGMMMMMMGKVTRLDGGREARVSRYREKRRRRLFSKKIRYQVRKLNAEKRPRIKGRFVKRSSFASGFPLLSTS